MWHLKTKLGTFWILDPFADRSKYLLGHDTEPLKEYLSFEDAVSDVMHQATGLLTWDMASRATPACRLEDWKEGEPAEWA